MRAEFDKQANAISIQLAAADGQAVDRGDEVHSRAIVAVRAGHAVEVQILYPDEGIGEPLAAVAAQYALDREALEAAAVSALAAPDRSVSVELAAAPRS